MSNLTQGLELERANSKKFQDALETEKQLHREQGNRQRDAAEDTRHQLQEMRQQKVEAELEAERLRIAVGNLEAELDTERVLQGDDLSELWCGCSEWTVSDLFPHFTDVGRLCFIPRLSLSLPRAVNFKFPLTAPP